MRCLASCAHIRIILATQCFIEARAAFVQQTWDWLTCSKSTIYSCLISLSKKKTDKMKEWRWRCLRDIGIRRKKVKKEREKKCFIGIRCTQWKDKTKWNSRILRATKRDEKILCYIWMRCANAHSSLHKTCACCLWEKLLQYWLIYLSVSRHTRIRHQCDSVDCDVAFLHIFGIQGGRFCRRPAHCFFLLLPFLFRSTCHSKWICNAASAAARL